MSQRIPYGVTMKELEEEDAYALGGLGLTSVIGVLHCRAREAVVAERRAGRLRGNCKLRRVLVEGRRNLPRACIMVACSSYALPSRTISAFGMQST